MRMTRDQYAARLKQQRGAIVQERDFQRQLMQAAKQLGWLAYHTKDSRGSAPGFPDTVLVKGTSLLFAELKMPGETPSNTQQLWLDWLGKVDTVETYVWTPDDFAAISTRLGRH